MFLLFLSLWLAAADEQPPMDNALRAERLVELLVAGEHQSVVEAFDEPMRKALPADKVAQAWKATTVPLGAWQGREQVRVEKIGKYEVVHIVCKFARGKIESRFTFKTDGKVTGWFLLPAEAYSPPDYVDPKAFTEVPVEIGKGAFLLTLPGTLSLPKADGRHPAIVLVHGSGPNDRDETIGPNKPFRDLAHGLASRGIAVLRYEKRTRQHALAMSLNTKLTVKEETIDDALAAVDLLAADVRIDPKRIYLLGHSLGGMLIPRLAARRSPIAGYISLAGSTRPLEDLVLEQTRYIQSLDGVSDEDRQQLATIESQVALVKSDQLTLQTAAKDLPLGIPAAYWLDLRDYRPAEEAKSIKQPILILQGERDYQVTMDDFALWKSALQDHKKATCRSYPQLNHLFMPGEGKSQPSEYLQASHVAKQVVDDIERWLRAQ